MTCCVPGTGPSQHFLGEPLAWYDIGRAGCRPVQPAPPSLRSVSLTRSAATNSWRERELSAASGGKAPCTHGARMGINRAHRTSRARWNRDARDAMEKKREQIDRGGNDVNCNANVAVLACRPTPTSDHTARRAWCGTGRRSAGKRAACRSMLGRSGRSRRAPASATPVKSESGFAMSMPCP